MKFGFLSRQIFDSSHDSNESHSATEQKARHLKQGALAEQIAATFLQHQGLILIEKNFRSKYGEIDLIMRDGNALVFVEVRLRASQKFGGAAASISKSKQQKLSNTAEFYLQQHNQPDFSCRFDVILMQAADANAVEWIKNAF